MAFNFSKIYDKINWRNKPDKTTPIDATNLGKIDTALDVIDDRVVALGKKANDVDEAISTLNSNLVNKIGRIYNNTSYATTHTIDMPKGSYYFMVLSLYSEPEIWVGISWSEGTANIVKMSGSVIESVTMNNWILTVTMNTALGCAVFAP